MRRALLFALALAFAAAIGILLNRETWELYREQVRQRELSDLRMSEAEAERARLLDRRSRIESPIGREELARERGYNRPGEEALGVAD